MNNIINILNQKGQLVVTSREVASNFNKRHDNVLSKVKTIINNWDENTDLKNKVSKYFIESNYEDDSGRQCLEYLLTRDGFSFLVMGFTGSKADSWKVKYIEAFNKMERAILNNQSITEFKVELESKVNEMVQAKINEIEKKCSSYYRPSAFEKSNISHYIKGRLGIQKANDEYELVKERVLIKLGATKWEDVDVETLKNSLNIIDESIRIIKLDRPQQTSLWD